MIVLTLNNKLNGVKMELDLAINNCNVFNNGKIVKKNIGVKKNKIELISSKKIKAREIIEPEFEKDSKNFLIIPGGIDMHVHFRTPGKGYKANFETESKAAVSGGITTVFDMPNTNPPIIDTKTLAKKRKYLKGKSFVNYGLFFGATNTNANEVKKAHIPAIKFYLGPTTGSLLINDDKAIEKIFRIAKEKNIVCFLHCEDEIILNENKKKIKGKISVKHHNIIRSIDAEVKMVEKALKIWSKVKNKVHFTHISTPQAIELILKAKKKSKKISFGVTPHHLFLNDSMLSKLKHFGKMNPPLRDKKTQQKLLSYLRKGLIDSIESDHAPHTLEEKKRDYSKTPSGVTGVQTLLPLILNEYLNKKISLKEFIKLVSENPARIMNLKTKGKIKKGFDADLTIINLKNTQTITHKLMHYKCGWTPFNNFKLKGTIHATIVNGKIAYLENEFLGKNGKEIK